ESALAVAAILKRRLVSAHTAGTPIMPRLQPKRPQRFFRGAEFGRLMTMIVMFVVLLMMIRTASNPGVWQWLVSKPAQQEKVVGEEHGRTAAPDSGTAGRTAPPSQSATGGSQSTVSSSASTSSRISISTTQESRPTTKVPTTKTP